MFRKTMIACLASMVVVAGIFATQAQEEEEELAPLFEEEAVVETYTLGSEVQPFSLTGTNGEEHSLDEALGEKVIALYFWNFKCSNIEDYEEHLSEVYNTYKDSGDVLIWVIDSNHDNTNVEIDEYIDLNERSYFVLRDPENRIADKFGAQYTPEAFVIGQDKTLQYLGAVADNPNPSEAEQFYMEEAITALLEGADPEVQETDAFGCEIQRVPDIDLDVDFDF